MNSETGTNNKLMKYGKGYQLLYELGTGLGAEISQLLDLTVDDVRDKEYLSMHVGPRKCRRTFHLTKSLRRQIAIYTSNREGTLFINDEGIAITEEDARKVLDECGIKKLFINILLGRYYRETGDIYYPMFFLDLPTENAAIDAIS